MGSPRALVVMAGLVVGAVAIPAEERLCGSERWAVKTATDGTQLHEGAPPEVRTVAQLSALEAPRYREARPREGEELNVVAVVGYLRAVKLEEDGDLHALISDAPDGLTMVVEIPDPGCAARSPYKDRMAAARAATAKLVGAVFGRKFRTLTTPPRVRVVGAIFFDKLHGQTGMAGNGVELHPVLDLTPAPEGSGG